MYIYPKKTLYFQGIKRSFQDFWQKQKWLYRSQRTKSSDNNFGPSAIGWWILWILEWSRCKFGWKIGLWRIYQNDVTVLMVFWFKNCNNQKKIIKINFTSKWCYSIDLIKTIPRRYYLLSKLFECNLKYFFLISSYQEDRKRFISLLLNWTKYPNNCLD